jgi:hypothetical protein
MALNILNSAFTAAVAPIGGPSEPSASSDSAFITASIFKAAKSVLRIHGMAGPKWRRNVASGARIGPWLQASFDVVDDVAWKARTPCLYMLAGTEGGIRYVGISRNRMADRWRVSPALDADTLVQLPRRQLFHSQCWKPMQDEVARAPHQTYEVRCIDGASLTQAVSRLGPPVSGFAVLAGDHEGVVAAVERWICNQQTAQLVPWNKAMTRRD